MKLSTWKLNKIRNMCNKINIIKKWAQSCDKNIMINKSTRIFKNILCIAEWKIDDFLQAFGHCNTIILSSKQTKTRSEYTRSAYPVIFAYLMSVFIARFSRVQGRLSETLFFAIWKKKKKIARTATIASTAHSPDLFAKYQLIFARIADCRGRFLIPWFERLASVAKRRKTMQNRSPANDLICPTTTISSLFLAMT